MRKTWTAGLVGIVFGGGAMHTATPYLHLRTLAEGAIENRPGIIIPKVDPEARRVTDALLDRLKAGKVDEFATSTRASMHLITDSEYNQFRKNLLDSRVNYNKAFGPSLNDFEVVHEQAGSPSVVRLVYLERFEKSGLLWTFVMYKGKDGWKVATVNWAPDLGAAF